MSTSRAIALLLASVFLLSGTVANAQIGIVPIPDQNIPSGKTLVVPIAATDPTGPGRSFKVTVGPATVSGTTTPATQAGVNAVIRTGDPSVALVVSYADSNSVMQTGTMEFQLLREFAPLTTQIISGLLQGGFYDPVATGGTTKYITFHRIAPGFVIQGGDPLGTGLGGPGFSFPDEHSSALIFSSTAGQLAMAHSGSGFIPGHAAGVENTTVITGTDASTGDPIISNTTVNVAATTTTASEGTNGSQFFITLGSDRSDLDFGYTVFGQLIYGYNTLFGIAGTPTITDTNMTDQTLVPTSFPINPVNILQTTTGVDPHTAILLLSATGVCDAKVTVTAYVTSGTTVTSSTSTSFVAHAVADTFNDPPFYGPVPDVTAPNGAAKVTLSGTDLQFDLLTHGAIDLLPATGASVNGTSPTISIPLVSNTDNTVAAEIDTEDPPSPMGSNTLGVSASPLARVFHIGAGDTPIYGGLYPIPAGARGLLNLPTTNALAVFATANRADTASSFTANINWGDSTYVSGSDYRIVPAGPHVFKLLAGHDYTHPGQFPILVDIADRGGARLHLSSSVNVSATTSGIELTGMDFSHTGTALTNQFLATFKDAGPTESASSYLTYVNWGDGVGTSGTVVAVKGGQFVILGSHTYQYPATYTVFTQVSGTIGTGAAAGFFTTATISGSGPQIFPPFPQAHLAQVWSAIYSDSDAFISSGSNDGGNPYAGLASGSDNLLYGSTVNGGANGAGTVFQISTTGTFTSLYSFTSGTDGAHPYGGVFPYPGEDYIYGTTETGGTGGQGTIFQLSTSGSINTLYSFDGGANGGNPYSALVEGTDGNLYGTASAGGQDGDGTLYSLTLSDSTVNFVHFFIGSDGSNPRAAVLLADDNNFYGTTVTGGTSGGFGTVYEVHPGSALASLYSFTSGADGANPYSALVEGTDGFLYGTCQNGGNSGMGTVYQISKSGAINPLYSFTGGSDGGNPIAGVVFGADGNLYGSTTTGGDGHGTLFSIATDGTGFNAYYTFTGGSDGSAPSGTLVADTAAGIFFGTTQTGGSNGFGTVYSVVPDAGLDTLHSFTSGSSYQLSLRCSVAIINSGDRVSSPGTFSVYLGSGQSPDPGTPFSSNGVSTFSFGPLQPGATIILSFHRNGSTDDRLHLPVGIPSTANPVFGTSTFTNTYPVTGVLNYTDPVGDFDGAEKTFSPFSF